MYFSEIITLALNLNKNADLRIFVKEEWQNLSLEIFLEFTLSSYIHILSINALFPTLHCFLSV